MVAETERAAAIRWTRRTHRDAHRLDFGIPPRTAADDAGGVRDAAYLLRPFPGPRDGGRGAVDLRRASALGLSPAGDLRHASGSQRRPRDLASVDAGEVDPRCRAQKRHG